MKHTVLLLIAIVIFVQLSAQQKALAGGPKIPVEDCRALIEYRDTKLLQVWDKTVEKYVIPKNYIADLNKHIQELNDDTWYATTDWHVLSISLKITSDLVADMLKIVAPLQAVGSKVVTAVGKYEKRLKNVESFLKKVNNTKDALFADDAAEAMAYQAAKELAELTPYGAIPTLINNMRENLNTANDYSDVKTEVRQQLRNFNKAIENYNKKVIPLKANMEEVNEYKKYIDEYLKENCGNMPVPAVKPASTGADNSREIYRKNIPGASLLATYQDQAGQWVAIGPYMTTDGFATEQAAIESLFYTNADLTLVNDKGKYKIYQLNLKAEHDARDVREILKKLGAENIPN